MYSDNNTKTHNITKILERKTGFEWGMKIGAVTKSDISKQFQNREKAMYLWVEDKNVIPAETYANRYFAQNPIFS